MLILWWDECSQVGLNCVFNTDRDHRQLLIHKYFEWDSIADTDIKRNRDQPVHGGVWQGSQSGIL